MTRGAERDILAGLRHDHGHPEHVGRDRTHRGSRGHFVGYSASQAGRNHAPVHAGPREIADVFLPPFEMAVRDGGVRSVMNSYTDVDGIPVASDEKLLTGVLRDEWGFDGVVVSDYFAVAFLQTMHAVAADRAEAAALALTAGIDVELPTGDAYAQPLRDAVRRGDVDVALIDRALGRVLAQKEELGLLDPDESEPPTQIDLDTPEHRRVARELAERSLVLLSNDGTLPLRAAARIAVIGPNGDDASALMGCYSFANHVLAHHPRTPLGFAIPTSLDLPGVQRRLVEEVVATGTPTVLVVVTGRPYALGWALDGDAAPAAVVQAFFPGEEGGVAVARLVSGAASPSGRLPVSLPRSAGAQPFSYLHPPLGGANEVTSADSTPVRPVAQLLGYTRVTLEPGASAQVHFAAPTARLTFTGRDGRRRVEPGRIDLWVGASCADRDAEAAVTLTGDVHHVTAADPRLVAVRVE